MGIDYNDITQDETVNEETAPVEESGIPRKYIIWGGAIVVVILALIGLSVWALIQPSTDTARVRDIFIIFMALESIMLGLVLILLVIQLARLTNLLQNEIKPILESTNETVSTLRGTTEFLSDNLVEPVIKLNGYMAAFQQMVTLIGLGRKRTK